MCLTEITKIKRKNINQIILYEIYVIVDVIKSKLIIVILKEQKGLRAQVLV